MAAQPSPRLASGGRNVVAADMAGEKKSVKDMSIGEMENALERFSKRLPDKGNANYAPQTARALLEENKQLIQEKRDRKALERQNSREFTETLLAKDRLTTDNDKARDIGRRHAQRELAQYYKSQIAKKENSKSSEYSRKVDSGVAIQYFPFVEGENINASRQVQAQREKEEMRVFLKKQLQDNPPRTDSLLEDVDNNYAHKYPAMPVHGRGNQTDRPSSGPRSASCGPAMGISAIGEREMQVMQGDEVAPHMQRYPRFLSRAREHMSRRLHDAHVRKTLEDQVRATKSELEAQAAKRSTEAQQADDGMLVNDALRYDSSQAKAVERRRNAEHLMQQIEEKQKIERDFKQARNEPAGYWGPEEKGVVQGSNLHKVHCSDLLKQMEVNQHRKLDSRSRRLRQERRLVDNCMAEMSQDRERDRQKAQQHKDVLVTTWKSQQKIKQALTHVEHM
jgi:hypothetical protein